MSKEEIKALVAAKIAGQGTMVDAGSALPKIINAIVDLIPEVQEPMIVTDSEIGTEISPERASDFENANSIKFRGNVYQKLSQNSDLMIFCGNQVDSEDEQFSCLGAFGYLNLEYNITDQKVVEFAGAQIVFAYYGSQTEKYYLKYAEL